MNKKIFAMLASFLLLLTIPLCIEKSNDEKFKEFLERHVGKIEPLMREEALVYWQACLTGKSEDYERYANLELEIKNIYSSKEDFEFIKDMKDKIKDPILSRQANLLYNNYLGNQINKTLLEQIVRKSNKIELKFNTFRGKVNGKEVTMGDIREILEKEKDSSIRKKAWEAQKQVGEIVAEDLIELVKLRNEAAKEIGFKNYYQMALALQEQNETDLIKIFDQLDKLTYEPFRELKKIMDEQLARKYRVKNIMPWHYSDPFFQEVPKIYKIDLDKFYKDKNILELDKKFYSSIGFNVEDILDRSSLYEKPGKYPHAYTIDIDREGDVRLMLNLRNNSYWMGTIMHESGHGVNFKGIDPNLPFLLREPAHILTTEAIALFFERLPYNASWLEDIVEVTLTKEDEKELSLLLQAKELIFARWVLVMFNFERQLYENPNQDLNKLWWNLKAKYQLVKPPLGRDKPDYAAKIHLISAPVYYHNYMLGELFASQLHHYIIKNILKEPIGYQNHLEVGEYLKEKVFYPGSKYPWDKLIEYALGEELSSKYFAEQFCISTEIQREMILLPIQKYNLRTVEKLAADFYSKAN